MKVLIANCILKVKKCLMTTKLFYNLRVGKRSDQISLY